MVKRSGKVKQGDRLRLNKNKEACKGSGPGFGKGSGRGLGKGRKDGKKVREE